MRREALSILSKSGRHDIVAEIALTPQEQAQGLMFRTSIADADGMLFVYDKPQQLHMWMHNTYVSLDMVFIAADGTIARIEASAEPLSDRVINSGAPVVAVLELKAGAATTLALAKGDHVDAAALRR